MWNKNHVLISEKAPLLSYKLNKSECWQETSSDSDNTCPVLGGGDSQPGDGGGRAIYYGVGTSVPSIIFPCTTTFSGTEDSSIHLTIPPAAILPASQHQLTRNSITSRTFPSSV